MAHRFDIETIRRRDSAGEKTLSADFTRTAYLLDFVLRIYECLKKPVPDKFPRLRVLVPRYLGEAVH